MSLILFDIRYLGRKTRPNEKLPIVEFEVRPLPGESSKTVLARSRQVWRQGWAQFQMAKKGSGH
jgi:hypothetical protein